ncbi:TIGR04283 family arsenosugar biosynthesis glycosyltransferase [Desulfococcus multivorans]|nr:TIGR04283 family arsenosugar biosynthesis glycosyltransferase [Desulfococcus multivorans]AOY59889.1 glycosyltransferase, family II [Desulfococcus multivorans]MDX9818131.1 TIGR04283 family arsenosugar biosynthesis glycosyltransferase [Desulfococcus multivorans]
MLKQFMRPAVSIVIPVFHEAHIINPLVGHLLRMPFAGKREIIVVDGAASGDSLRAIRDPRAVKLRSTRGRAVQMNTGARHATGDILLFLHADTRLPDDGLERIIEALQAKDFVGGAFDLAIDSPRPCFRWIEKAASRRSRITRIPYGDQAIFIRKAYFLRHGGFAAIPIMEDVELMRRIRRRGDRIILLPHRVTTSARRWERTGVCRNTLRNWMLLILYHAGVAPERLSLFYR